jgi:hypothetical protein
VKVFSEAYLKKEEHMQPDWLHLKTDYANWRTTLFQTSKSTLKTMAADNISMATLNTLGVFHKLGPDSDDVKREYRQRKLVPHHWITKGNYPGIWCALFHEANTFSIDDNPEIIKITFKAEYKIFDPKNKDHQKLWHAWYSFSNLIQSNPWLFDWNSNYSPMASRMHTLCEGVFHHAFFKEHNFGAFIGYSDYMALVVVQEEAIDTVTFLNNNEDAIWEPEAELDDAWLRCATLQ